MEIKGIKYVAPCFDGSGYAQASRGYILALNKLGIPLTVHPVSFEKTYPELGEDGEVIKSLVNKDIDYNVVIMHLTPEHWTSVSETAKVNVGYTIWETTKLHPKWPEYINDGTDKILVGSSWNVDVFKSSGVKVPIGVVPHGINTDCFDGVKPYEIVGMNKDAYMFYDIFQWCYDKKTRVLTDNGFKYFKDLSYDDYIATLNLNTEEFEYQKPEKIVKFRRKDKMFSLKGALFDICVTPNHNMVVKEEGDLSYKFVQFNELLSKGKFGQMIISEKYKAKKNCKWNGKEQPVFKVPMLDNSSYPIRDGVVTELDMDVFLEFIGWYLSEGSTYVSERGYVTSITQYKRKYRSEIIDCIKKMGYKPFEGGNGYKDIRFNSREMCYYLKQFGKCNDKFIPKWIKGLSARQINIMLKSLFKGDGSLYENGDFVKYTTTSKQLAEDVQECLLKVGMSGSISIADPKLKTQGKIDGRVIEGKLLQYTVSVNRKRNEPSMYYANLEEIEYDDYVYCATVPNHAMLVERNGKILFSGNTERKNPVDLLKAYWYAFPAGENVALVLKTYRFGYTDNEKEAIRQFIIQLKKSTPMDNYPKVYLISDLLSDEEILGLHKRGDCFVSLNRGEGYGLCPFTAATCGNPIITTGFGGVTEFANHENSYLLDYSLKPVSGMTWSPWYRGDQLWAVPDVLQASKAMQHVYMYQNEARERGENLRKNIVDNFTWEKVGTKMIEEIEKI